MESSTTVASTNCCLAISDPNFRHTPDEYILSITMHTPRIVPFHTIYVGTVTYPSMVRFSNMVVTPRELTVQTAIRPRIVMLWVFFLVTVVVVGPSVPASAFVSCTWHHGQLVGEHSESVAEESQNISTVDTKAPHVRCIHHSWQQSVVSNGLSFGSLNSSPVSIIPTGIAPRAPPASR